MIGERALPEGRPGQALAVGLTLLLLALFWLGAVSPVLGWYHERQNALATAQQESAHMAASRRMLPALRQAAADAAAPSAGAQILLAGDSDAIAGANLQSVLQDLASQTETSLDSVAMTPTQPVGALRRIGAAVSVTATWSTLIALLEAIDTARPRMIASDFSITAAAQTDPRQDVALQAEFTVAAFRAGNGQ